MRTLRVTRPVLGLLLVLGLDAAAGGATITVTTAADSGAGSLRAAITSSNASAGTLDTIAFAIPGAGVHTIALASALPPITDPAVLDATTQTGFAGLPLIEIDGSNAGGFTHGFNITAGGTTVRGFAIHGFASGNGVVLFTGDGNTIVGNFIGTNAAGTAALPNQNGVNVSFDSTGNTIGGDDPADRNVISGNSTGIILGTSNNLVRGNRIGTDPTGQLAVGNGTGISDGHGGNTIERNLISGNGGVGVTISAASAPTNVQENFIGVDVTGLEALGNGSYGVTIFVGSGHTIRSNVISDNFAGIGINAAPGAIIQGNFIGTDAPGLAAIPNGFGIGVFNGGDGAVIGGAAAGPGQPCAFPCNLISGNAGHGIQLGTGGSSIGQEHDVVQGNCIGTQVDCVSPLPNAADGIHIGFQASDETIGGTAPGEGNTIAFNRAGIRNDDGARDAIRGNSIFRNDNLGIDLGSNGVTANDPTDADGGANLLQNFPIVTSVEPALASGPQGASTRIQGFIRGAAGVQLEIDFFSNASCADRPQEFLEGQRYLGSASVTTDGTGFADIDATLPVDVAANDPVSATATDPLGNTSEFSQRLPFSVTPASGPPAGGTPLTISGTDFAAGATVHIGAATASNVVVNNSNSITATSPLLAAGTVNDLTVTNPDGSEGTLPRGYVADFLDVSPAAFYYSYVTTLVRNAITVGVGGGLYGGVDNTLRQQMAVFLMKAKHGLCFIPPPCTVATFTDVPCSSGFAPWIYQLVAEGVTGGCGNGTQYCPTEPVLRQQMAVLLLRAFEGAGYTPPACANPTFSDVPCSSPFAPWIYELVDRGITVGCGGNNYCPGGFATRGQMAVFVVKTFGLQ